jgi:hypothetical protein
MIDLDTLVVAVLSAFLGGLAATWLRLRHERDEAMRDRQLTAADDFATSFQQAINAVELAWKACLEHGFLDEEENIVIRDPRTRKVPAPITAALNSAGEKIAETHARQARVALLFGPYAPSPRSGDLGLMMLDDALRSLSGWPRPSLDQHRERMSEARDDLRSFNDRALADIRGRPWHRRWRSALWIRRRIRKLRERRAERRSGTAEGERSDDAPDA